MLAVLGTGAILRQAGSDFLEDAVLYLTHALGSNPQAIGDFSQGLDTDGGIDAEAPLEDVQVSGHIAGDAVPDDFIALLEGLCQLESTR